jgi:hypothetical protein
MATNPDFRDLFAALCDAQAEFLVVGAHAVMVYTEPRYTKDLDVWVRPSEENSVRVYRALETFGAPLADLRSEDLATEGVVFQIGIAPNRIDILTVVDGLAFEDAWPRRIRSTYAGIPIALLSAEDLIQNKRTVGRPQDLLDVAKLEAALRDKT